MDAVEQIVYHVQQKRLFGWVKRVNGFFADVQSIGHLLQGKPQALRLKQCGGRADHALAQLHSEFLLPSETRLFISVSIVAQETNMIQAVS